MAKHSSSSSSEGDAQMVDEKKKEENDLEPGISEAVEEQERGAHQESELPNHILQEQQQ